MDVKRRLSRAVSVLAVAILLGHLVQTMSADNAAQATSATPAATDPKAIVPVAAGPRAAVTPSSDANTLDTAAVVEPAEPATPTVVATPAPDVAAPLPTPVLASMTTATILPQQLSTVTRPPLPPSVTTAAAEAPTPPAPTIVSTTEPEPSIVPKAMEVLLQPDQTCKDELDLTVVADGIIEITLLAPCHADERLVLRHGPLAVTARTTAAGSAFLKVPALDAAGEVSLRFADGKVITGAVPLPDLSNLRRFAVQWMDRDTFGVNAFESGAGYGEPGHVSAANPGNLPLTGKADAGYLMILGDADASPAMLAEVYTYPAGITDAVEISVEVEVTADTCGRELLGEVITSNAGLPVVSDLALVVPDCAALGDILVLKNPVQGLTLAAAN